MKMRLFPVVLLVALVCIGFVSMLAENADAQSAIRFEAETEVEQVPKAYQVGDDPTPLTITLTRDGELVTNERVLFKVAGLVDGNNKVLNPSDHYASVNPAEDMTDDRGQVTTWVTFHEEGRIGIEVDATNLGALYIHAFEVGEVVETTRIVAMPSNVESLAVNDTFTYSIDIENVQNLAAYSIDVAFNPNVLEVVAITEGDFLERDGLDAFFYDNPSGTIKLAQTRIDRTYDATTGAEVLAPLGKGDDIKRRGTLVTIEFMLKEFAEEALGLHNIQLSDYEGARVSYSVEIHPVVATHMFPAADVNRDGIVNVLDLTVVAQSLGKANPINPRADVNDDGIVNALDLVTVAKDLGKSTPAAKVRGPNTLQAAPAADVANLMPETIQGWIDIARVEDDGSAIFDLGIANLQQMLQATVPEETKLLLNYPNPFNPETWIPYQLAKSTDVTVSIYSVNGTLVRTLALGHQAAGVYQSKSQAAYWDGRNELGEQVASGVYFYTLIAGDFSATGKMLVRK